VIVPRCLRRDKDIHLPVRVVPNLFRSGLLVNSGFDGFSNCCESKSLGFPSQLFRLGNRTLHALRARASETSLAPSIASNVAPLNDIVSGIVRMS